MSNEAENTTPVPAPQPPTTHVGLPAEKVVVLNLDDVKPNSILVINVNIESPEEKMALAPVFARLLSPFSNILREKRVSVMLMSKNENINIVSEEDMNAAGWFKKEKSLIINPFDKR